MFQQLQEYLKETNIKIFLKYDGERIKERHTVVLYDLKDSSLTLSKETDYLKFDFFELLKSRGIVVSKEDYEFLIYNFFHIRDILIEKYGNKVVVAFTIENKEQIEYCIYLQCREIMKRYSDFDFNEILDFVNSL
jgi:hypothetical protein